MGDIYLRAKPLGQVVVMMTLVLVLMVVGFGPVQASEAEIPAGHLEGIIYKADGETPLSDAQMILEKIEKGKKTGETVESNITDETGEYKLQNIPVGFYRGKILVKKKHYRIKRLDFFVHVIDGETNFLSFSLKRVKGGLP
jgi:hypothetical protein